MDVNNNKPSGIKGLFSIFKKQRTPYIPALHRKIEDTFVRTTKQESVQETKGSPVSPKTEEVQDTPVVLTREIFEANLNRTSIPSDEKRFISEYTESDEQMVVFNKLITNQELMGNKAFTEKLTKYISNVRTPEQLMIFDKFLSNPRLYKLEDLQKQMIHILQCTFSKEDADSTIAIFDKILSIPDFDKDKEVQSCATKVLLAATDENKSKIAEEVLANIGLYKSQLMQACIIDSIYSISTPKQAENVLSILQKISDIPDFEKQEELQEVMGDLIKYSSTQVKTNLALKFLSNPELYSKYGVQNSMIKILAYANTKERADIADRFLSDSELYESKFYQRNISKLMDEVVLPVQFEFVNKILSEPRLYKNKSLQYRLNDILKYSRTKEFLQPKIDVIDKFLSDERLYANESLQKALGSMVYFTASADKVEFQIQMMDKFLVDSRLQENIWLQENIGSIFTYANTEDKKEVMTSLMDNPEELANLTKQLTTAKEKVLLHPELYVNGTDDSVESMQKQITDFYDKNSVNLLLGYKYLCKESVDNILRMRLVSAKDYLNQISRLNLNELELLQGLCNSKDKNGNSFNPAQKVQFINLINAYKDNQLEYTEMTKMVSENKVDFETLNRNLFKEVMKNMGIPEEKISLIPEEKLTSWDTKYMHLLAKELKKEEDSNAFKDLINAANFEEFSEYIHDETNIYGQTNAVTKTEFERLGMDYATWLNPSEDSAIKFVVKDKNQEQLSQISSQIIEDIEALRKTPVKGMIDKRFKNFVKKDEFIIPQEISSNKTKLESFTQNIIEQLDDVWKRAKGNLDNPQRAENAKNTLTILDHLNQRVSDISAVDTSAGETKTIDVTIKMWDRVPQKDIFQGNYSTCCIGMGAGNGSAMPHYLLNTAYNMIELVDNQTGNVIGNALCYMATDANNNPMFIVDNIEVSNSHKTTDEVGKKLRTQITEYASKVAKQVTGRNDIPIYMGNSYNDVPTDDLKQKTGSVKLLGQVDCDSIYMDLFDGWIDPKTLKNNAKLLQLK